MSAPPLSAGLQGAHAALLGHANEVRALAHLANFESRIDDVGFEWIETMLLHARDTFEKYCCGWAHRLTNVYAASLTESNPPSDDVTLGTQTAAITLASEMLKTPSRRRANAALFPGGAAAATSRRRAAAPVSSESGDKENAPVTLAAAESASSSSGTAGLGIGARSTRSRADKSEIIKMPNPFASKKGAAQKSSSDKDAPLAEKPAKAPKKALRDAAAPQQVPSSSSADAELSSAEEPAAPAKKAKKGTKASAAAAKAAAKAARAEEAAAEPKPAKRKAAKGKAAAASDAEGSKPAPAAAAPASASSKASTPPPVPAAAMPRAASQFFDVDDDNSRDLDATMAHEADAVRASTPLPAGAKKGVPATRSREESLELIAPSHATDSDDDDDAQELVSAREKLSETSGSPVLPAEEQAGVKTQAAEKPAAKPAFAEPVVVAPKRTLGDYGISKKTAPAGAAAASAGTAAASSSTSSSSTHASSTPAAPAFRSSFLNKSLRKAVTSAQEADEEADSESDDSDEPPLRAGKRAAKAATSANTRANATAAGTARTRAAAKRKSDEMEAPADAEEAPTAAARPPKAAKLAASVQASDPPRTLGTAAASSAAAAPPQSTQSGFDAIRSRLENVRRISGAHRGNAAAALPVSTSAAGSAHVGLGASLATSIFATRAPGAASAAPAAPVVTATATAPPAAAAAGTRVRDSDDAAEWQDSTGEPSLESANDDFVAAIKAKSEQFQAEVAASKAPPAQPAKAEAKATTAPAQPAATSNKPAPASTSTGSTTPIHSPTAAPPAARPPITAMLNADDECAVATESESEGEAGADEVILQPRAAPVTRRADDEMTLDELVAGPAKAAPAPSDKSKAAAAATRPTPAASVGPSSAYAAQQARNNLGATNGSTAARPLASMPKVSVNLTGKSAAANKSLHRSQHAPAAAQAQQQRRDEAAREKQREETAHAAAAAHQPSDSAAHAPAPAPGRGGWGILDKAKGFLGFNGGMPSSASGFMPTRPGAAASSGSKVPVAPSSPGKSPRKNSTAGPGGNPAASMASQGKPASLARAEAARRREAEEADRRRREKDERRNAAQAEKDAKSKAEAEREAERRKRAREPEAGRLPMARVPEMAQSKNKAPVSIAVAAGGKAQVRKDDDAGGKKRRVSDDGASVPGDGGASALARSTAAAPPPAGAAAFKPARPGAPSTGANVRPQQLQASASGIPRGAGFASQQYQQQHAQQQLQQAQAARAAQQASAAAVAAAAAASIQRPGAPRPMPPAAGAGSSSSTAARPAPPVVAREVTPEIVLSDPNSEYSDSDASDVEERRAKERPWEREELQAALRAQAARDPDAIFGIPHGSVPAHEWFANHGSRREMEQTQQRLNRPRSSSGTWTRGDALNQAEIDRYNVQMGIVPAGVRLAEQRSSARPSPRAPPRPSTLALDAAAQARASQQQGQSRAGAPGSSRP